MLNKTNTTADNAVVKNQLKIIEENIRNIPSTNIIEYMRKKLPYCAQSFDGENFLFYNRDYEVIHNLILPSDIDADYNKESTNFKQLYINVELAENYVFYDDNCKIWESKKFLNIYINEIKRFLEVVYNSDFIIETRSKAFSVKKY